VRAPGATPAIRLADLGATTVSPVDQHDFQHAALNLAITLRWEYHLGSVIYIVYTRSQVPQVELMRGERRRLDISLLPRAPAADVLLVKLSYWFG
jgi:hypothetical protein